MKKEESSKVVYDDNPEFISVSGCITLGGKPPSSLLHVKSTLDPEIQSESKFIPPKLTGKSNQSINNPNNQ